jgi:hypothetical protein
MSFAAIFVFLLVSAQQTLDSVLDLARKVRADKILSFSLFIQENVVLLERKRFQIDKIEAVCEWYTENMIGSMTTRSATSCNSNCFLYVLLHWCCPDS